ncbi:MAG: M28 family peptidase [Sphingomicrobium sp.]
MIGQRGWVAGVLVVALLMLGFGIKGVLITPPSPPSQAGPGEFDTDRAISRLQRILGDERPHPVDTAADDAVRGRLIAELQAMGLQPQVRDAMDCSGFPNIRVVSCSHVRNVIADIPGRAPGRALLLDAHYDSTPTGPGAGDDGVGVATLLEIAAILRAEPPQRRVMFLFNEGEEFGLNGSAAFVRTDPLARQVNSLINIDARGVTGPALMYETSQPNGAALSIYGRDARRPYANSLSTDFARLIPNTTDVVKFKPAHWTLLNFGIIGNETRYHSPSDTVAALNRASFYHVGSEVLTLTRAMANTPDPANAGQGQTVFTDIAGRVFVQIPLPFAAVFLGLLLIVALALAWRERAVGKPLLRVAGITFAGIGASGFVAFFATMVRPGDFWRAYPQVTYLAVYAVLIAAMAGAWGRWGAAVERWRMRAAAWLFILLIGTALSIALPGAIIFFLFAPAVAILGIALSRRARGVATALAVLAIVVQFLIFAQMLALIEALLIDGPLWAVAPLAALAVLPALVETDNARLRPAVAVLVAASLSLWAAAMLLPRSSTERPASFSIDYFRDADQKTASWGIAAKQAPLPDGYRGDWHQGTLPYNGRTRWIAAAPLLATPLPSARVIASEPAGNGRRVRIVLSPGGGDAVSVRFAKDTKLLAMGLPGAPVPIPATGQPDKPLLRCTGRSCSNLVIEAVLSDKRPVQAELFSYRFALPPEGGSLRAAQPKNAIPQYAPDSTITMTRVRL